MSNLYVADLIKKHQNKINNGKSEDVFLDYLKYDPGLISTLKSLPLAENLSRVKCVLIVKRFIRTINGTKVKKLAWTGAALGIALMFTGVGAGLVYLRRRTFGT